MRDPYALCLIKFFSKERYADDFLHGRLHLQRLSYFKSIETAADVARADPAEATAMWWQPQNFYMDLNVPKIGRTWITPKDLAGPVSMSFAAHDHVHVYCLYAMHAEGFELSPTGQFNITTNEADALRAAIAIDDRCLQFGNYAVLINCERFLNRVRTALKLSGMWHKAGLVHYYDERTFHGEIPRGKIAFWKQKRFRYQKEYRIVVRTGTEGTDPLPLAVGDISAFSYKVDASKLNSLWQLRLDSAA